MGKTTSPVEIHISLLGGFSAEVAGQPVEDRWRLRKAKTLVKLLALAPGHWMHRDVVADRLWPEATPQAAANNLYQVVHSIRRLMGAESIAVNDEVVRLCPAGGLRIDVDAFEQATAAARKSGETAALQAALALWTGPLLPEDQYAEWAADHRERLGEAHAALVALLGSRLSEAGDHEAAVALLEPHAYARPLDERLHRVLIGALADLGRRWEAIETYERLRDALDHAYAADPEPMTKALYRRLLTRDRPAPGAQLQGSLQRLDQGADSLVGREPEWERLASSWQRASAGESHLFLITGEAGIGKTRLAEELLAWADQHDIASARTRCYSAEGRLALAPVAEWLRSDVIRQSVHRLADVWLTEIARLLPELLNECPRLPRPEPIAGFGQRQRFFEALSRAVLAVPQPLLLLIDDVQWCDQQTLQWLHFLLRFDPKKRLLLVGTARSEELVPPQPVAEWLVQLRSEGNVVELGLGPLDAAETAQLAVQVSKRELDEGSSLLLYRETEGNPLFVVEMASAGLGREPTADGIRLADLTPERLATAHLPPRMHAVIAGRLTQLSPGAQDLAGLAATVGRNFTVEVLRKASGLDAASLTDGLDELWQRRIIRTAPQQATVDSPKIPRGEPRGTGWGGFDFAHDKIRDVAYAELSPMRQAHGHLHIAWALEELYAADLDPVSAQLASHYELAGESVRAIPYYQRAAEVAQRVYAHEEAIDLLTRGLRLANDVRDRVRCDELRLALLRLLSLALVATRGYGAPEVIDTLSQAQTLNHRLGKPPDPLLLRALAIAAVNSRNFQQALACGDDLLRLADQQGDPMLLVEGHYVLGVTLTWTASFLQSRHHLEQALAHHDPTHSLIHIARYSQEPGVICQCRLGFVLWCLGYPEQAEEAQSEGLIKAQALGHPFSLAYALTWDAMLHGMMGNVDSLLQSAEAVLTLSAKHHLRYWSSWATVLRGWALAERGEPELGITEIRHGDEEMGAAGGLFLRPFVSLQLADLLAKLGRVEHGLELVNEALASTCNDPYWCDAELERLAGELLLTQGVDVQQAEAAYQRAIQIAQAHHAKPFELRARTSWARLLSKQGSSAKARQVLAGTYDWFTEGLDTPDLRNARALLESL